MTCTMTPGLHNDGCGCPPDERATPPDCAWCEGGAVTVQKTMHREYDARGRRVPVQFLVEIGSCRHSLRHRIVRERPGGVRDVVSEAITEYATAG